MKKISILVACYNEEENARPLAESIVHCTLQKNHHTFSKHISIFRRRHLRYRLS